MYKVSADIDVFRYILVLNLRKISIYMCLSLTKMLLKPGCSCVLYSKNSKDSVWKDRHFGIIIHTPSIRQNFTPHMYGNIHFEQMTFVTRVTVDELYAPVKASKSKSVQFRPKKN